MSAGKYTAMLGAGLGLIQETHALLELWSVGMSAPDLERAALHSGRFANVSARRLENIVSMGFAHRYLHPPVIAATLRQLEPVLTRSEFTQLLYLHTCRANPVLADFVAQVYWPTYAAGKGSVSNEQARQFVTVANLEGKMAKPWTDSMLRRVSGYLTGCCADFGLLESGKRSERAILPFRIESRVFVYLAVDLHLTGLSDASVLDHCDWQLFGLDSYEVLAEMKRQSPKGLWLVQSAGALARITWHLRSREELIDAFTKGQV